MPYAVQLIRDLSARASFQRMWQSSSKWSLMNPLLKVKLDQSFQLTHDLVVHFEEASLGLDLPNLPSNRISGQLWCIVGARESYLKAIKTGSWQGFTCSLTTPQVKQSVLTALETTHRQLEEIAFADLTEAQVELAFALLEHEVQHHGQLIRYVYGNRLTFPASWSQRYTLTAMEYPVPKEPN